MSFHLRAALVAAFLLGTSLVLPGQAPSAVLGGAGIWSDVDEKILAQSILAAAGHAPRRDIVPRIYRTVALNKAALKAVLDQALPEQAGPIATTGTELALPLPTGDYGRFLIQESPIMAPELAKRFPELKTYVAQGIDDPSATARIDVTPRGFHAIILSGHGDIYIDPYSRETDTNYVSYFKRDFLADKPFSCLTEGETREHASASRPTPYRPTGSMLRTYRLALACTGEYAAAVCSPNAATLPGTLSAMITSVNRCSAVYEREFAIRFQLINNDDKLVYLDGTTDPYTNGNGSTMLGQNQTTIDNMIGTANYDFGHVFSTGGGGVANLGVICRSGQKARGVTGLTNPTGDPYDIDYVVHEMGHEFGANHPFNSSVSNCGGANRNANTAYEVGSGTTIMAYAGICGNTNLAPHSDDYFYTISYDEIDAYTSTGLGGGCPVSTATSNTPPTIGALSSFTIPAQTPFALTASATDPDGDTLTYCWEEFDKGSAQSTANPVDTGNMPLFRSYPPTTNPTRVFPALTYILNNANAPPASNADGYSTGEVLPSTTRTMTFRVTVRDNRAAGGGSNWASTTVGSITGTGPFAVTAPNTATTIAGGSTQTVTWNVAGTSAAPISCANVKISLSTDGGRIFPFVLANSVPNNGSANVTIPNVANVATTQGRIKVESVGNIFFDISDANLTITSSNIAPVLSVTGSITVVRGTSTAAVATVGTGSDGDGNPVTVAVSDVPFGAHITPSIDSGNISFSATVDCSLVTTLATRTYPITLTVTDSIGSTNSGIVNLVVAPNPSPTLGAYSDVSVARGGSVTSTPAAQAADANGNLAVSPYSVVPTTLPGGGTITVNQSTGVVTATTIAGTTLGAISVRVTALDSCGASAVKFFNVTVVAPTAPLITNGPPPSPVIVGTPYSFSFAATGNPAPAFSLTNGALPPGLSISSGGVLSGTATSAGNGSFPNITVTASNGAAPNSQQTFSLSAVTQAANYIASFGLTGGNAEFLFDYDGDGIVNLLEYALGLDPTIASSVGLPVVVIKNYSGTKYLSMTFTRSSVATDLTYTVQVSSDLIGWSDLGSSVGGSATSGVGFVSETGPAPNFAVEVRDTVPVSGDSGQKRYMRLKVASP